VHGKLSEPPAIEREFSIVIYEPRADLAVTSKPAAATALVAPLLPPLLPPCLQVQGPLEAAPLLGFGPVDQSARHPQHLPRVGW
jgi:hypothetical protein